MEEKLNTLRAGVLGSNDGILTVVGVLVSVAAATSDPGLRSLLRGYLICLHVRFQWLLESMLQFQHRRIQKNRP